LRHKKLFYLLVVAALALPVVTLAATPAGAIANACTTSEFGNLPAGQSELKVACTLTTASALVGVYNKIEDFSFGAGAAGRAEAVWHVGAARNATLAASAASTTITSTGDAHFTVADINNGISGAGIPARAFIKAVTNATTAVLNLSTSGIAASTPVLIENSDGRTVVDAAYAGTATVTSNTAHFCKPTLAGCGTKNDVGRDIGGTRMKHGSKIQAVNSNINITLSLAFDPCPAGVTTCGTIDMSPLNPATSTHRYIDDGTVSTGTTLCSTQAKFLPTDVNLKVSGAAFTGPGDTYITAVAGGVAPCGAAQTKATLNQAATNGANTVVTIGVPNFTAPANGDAVSQLGAELMLNPTLVAGQQACTTNAPTGFQIQGKWLSPNAFVTTPFGAPGSATLPSASIIGELLYPTAAGINFAALIQQIPNNLAGETATAPHYDITYPFLPTAIALCPAPSVVGVGAVFKFNAISASQGLIPTGTGTPSTGQIRALQDLPAGTPNRITTSRLFIRQANGTTAVFTPPASNCQVNYPGIIDFHCGN